MQSNPPCTTQRIGGLFREHRFRPMDPKPMNQAPSEAALPRGFRFAATACGLKKTGALALALLSSDVPASAAAVFTQNLVVAAPVVVSKSHLGASKGRIRAVIMKGGNANVATGTAGYAASMKTVEEIARWRKCTTAEFLG